VQEASPLPTLRLKHRRVPSSSSNVSSPAFPLSSEWNAPIPETISWILFFFHYEQLPRGLLLRLLLLQWTSDYLDLLHDLCPPPAPRRLPDGECALPPPTEPPGTFSQHSKFIFSWEEVWPEFLRFLVRLVREQQLLCGTSASLREIRRLLALRRATTPPAVFRSTLRGSKVLFSTPIPGPISTCFNRGRFAPRSYFCPVIQISGHAFLRRYRFPTSAFRRGTRRSLALPSFRAFNGETTVFSRPLRVRFPGAPVKNLYCVPRGPIL